MPVGVPDDEHDPWDRERGESARQYERFRVYLGLGPQRRLTTVRERLGSLGDAIGYPALRQVSSAHRWAARADAWDRHHDAAEIEALRVARRDMITRHRRIAIDLAEVALRALRDLDERIGDVSMGDVVRALKLATDLERITLGEPTVIDVGTKPTPNNIGEHIATLSPDQRRQRLRELTEELAARSGLEVRPIDQPA
jgi:hypothetical protein